MGVIHDDIVLNKQQRQAVCHRSGPLLIIAGAGTGKTTVVTERIKWLISQDLVKPAEILALTFTEKAACEMEERVDVALPYGYTQMWITTFHAFGERVLRQEALQIGLDPGYRLMTEAESILFFRKNLFSFDLNYFRPLGNPTKFIEGMLAHFNRLKDEDVTPQDYVSYAENLSEKFKKPKSKFQIENEEMYKTLELAHAYRQYEELKIKEGVMDFADLISNVLMLFRKRKNILLEYQKKFKHILIDEFQDTNFAQNELAVLLAGEKKNITVVGDDDQAIYRWRGAAISNIIQFKDRFPDASLVVLNRNYRSTDEILNRAYTLIQYNNPDRLEVKAKINKKLAGERKVQGEEIECICTERVENEADEVVEKIKALKKKSEEDGNAYQWQDFAILVRANNHADPFTRALHRSGIPYQFLGPGMLFRQSEVKDLIAYLKLLNNFEDSVAVFRVLSMPVFDISSRDLAGVNNFAKRTGLSLFEAVEAVVAYHTNDPNHWSRAKNYQYYLPFINSKTKDGLKRFVQMTDRHLSLVKKDTAGQILYYFLEDTGLLKQLTEYKTSRQEQEAVNISKFFNKLKTFEVEHENATVQAVVEWIDMAMELGESPRAADTDWTGNNAVNLLTIHASKGLEFANVFLVNLVNNRFPTTQRKEQIPVPDALVKEILPEGDYHLEEERRLFYVGMTRARDNLILSASYFYGEGKRERKLSPFLVETVGDGVLQMRQKTANAQQLTLIEWKKVEKEEEQVSRQKIEYLSFSQIDTFMTCPLQYKYRYIIRIPVPPTAAGSFGSSMHLVLQKFYERVKRRLEPTRNDLIQLLDDVWLPIGYQNKQYEEKMKKRGKDMLVKFYDTMYDPHIVPLYLEQVFKIRLTPILKIGGKIDRVDLRPDGKLEIIDYKTGKRPTEKEIKENLQMTVYSLAATDPGIYDRKPEDVALSFYFFDTHEKVSTERTAGQLVQAKEKLLKISHQIETSTFEPKTGSWCHFCDFRLICEAWR